MVVSLSAELMVNYDGRMIFFFFGGYLKPERLNFLLGFEM